MSLNIMKFDFTFIGGLLPSSTLSSLSSFARALRSFKKKRRKRGEKFFMFVFRIETQEGGQAAYEDRSGPATILSQNERADKNCLLF